jgi:hypothetical protein
VTAELIFDLPNDGLNMAAGGEFLYVRCKRDMLKYNLADRSLAARNTIFKKDGKARILAMGDGFLALRDFCDLYILDNDLQVTHAERIGGNLSSDLCAVECTGGKAYMSIRNGAFAVMDTATKSVERRKLTEASTWDMALAGDKLYAGTTSGELLEIAAGDLRLLRRVQLCKPNVHSVLHHEGTLYAASRDGALRALDTAAFEVTNTAPKALGTFGILHGVWGDCLVAADWGEISLWDRRTLRRRAGFPFPTGLYNSGVLLAGDVLYGSNKHGITRCLLNENPV